MQTIQEILPKVLTGIQAPVTKENPVSIEAWARWFDFDTFGDPQLEKMLMAAASFVMDVKERKPCPWLVLLGTSGAGKTHLASRIWRWWKLSGQFYTEPRTGANCVYSGQFCLFADFIQEGREGFFGRAQDLMEDDFVIMDDIAAGSDNRGWITEKLYHIIERRLDVSSTKATIITANLSIEKLAEKYDQRIASRLVRRGMDKVIEVDVTDFSLR
jgi:DNA replication protein DnaC